jgi:hypothetical protein
MRGAPEVDRTSQNDPLLDKSSAPKVQDLAATPFSWRNHLAVHPAAELSDAAVGDEVAPATKAAAS